MKSTNLQQLKGVPYKSSEQKNMQLYIEWGVSIQKEHFLSYYGLHLSVQLCGLLCQIWDKKFLKYSYQGEFYLVVY